MNKRRFGSYGMGSNGRQRVEIDDLPRSELLRAVSLFSPEASDERLREFLKNIIDDASLEVAREKVEKMYTQGVRHNFLVQMAEAYQTMSTMNGLGEEVMTRLVQLWEKRADLGFQRICEHFFALTKSGEDGLSIWDRLDSWESLVRDNQPLPFEGIVTEITDSGMVINRLEKPRRELNE